MSTADLPALPEPHMRESIATAQNTRSVRHGYEQGGYVRWPDMYTADQMRDYARAAAAQRDEQIARLTAEVEALRALLRRQWQADAVLYAQPHDCSREEHLAAIAEHDACHAALGAALDAARAGAKPAEPMTSCPHGVPHRWPCETCDSAEAKGGDHA